MAITKVIKQMVDPQDNNVYIYPVAGIYSTFDNQGTPLDVLLDGKMSSPSSQGSNGQFLTTNGSGVQSWADVHDLTMGHRQLSDAGHAGQYNFYTEAEREYVYVEASSAQITIFLSLNNNNEHYVLVGNGYGDTITVGLVGAGQDPVPILGTGSIDIEAGSFCEIGIIRQTIHGFPYYVVTERILEPYTAS